MASQFGGLSDFAVVEAENFDATSKHLGFSAELLKDLDNVYSAITPLIKSPGGTLDTSDELLALVSIIHEVGMCRMLLTKSVLAALRMYRGESFTHTRRAIEACAFAVRMSKHNDLARIWAQGGLDKGGETTKYRAYRKAFRPEDVFPDKAHADHDPILTELKEKFDTCSKLIHGSPFGMAGHFTTTVNADQTQNLRVLFFDMPPDSFVQSFFHTVGTHGVMLRLFGRILEPYMTDFNAWKKEHEYVAEKLQRHMVKWLPNVAASIQLPRSGYVEK